MRKKILGLVVAVATILVSWQIINTNQKTNFTKEDEIVAKLVKSQTFKQIQAVSLRLRQQISLDIKIQKAGLTSEELQTRRDVLFKTTRDESLSQEEKIKILKNAGFKTSSDAQLISQEQLPLYKKLKEEIPEYFLLTDEKSKPIWKKAKELLRKNNEIN